MLNALLCSLSGPGLEINDKACLDEVKLESKVRKKGRKYGKVPMLMREASECRVSQLLSRFKGALWGVTTSYFHI